MLEATLTTRLACLLLVAGGFLETAILQLPRAQAEPPGWELVWSDPFDRFDGRKWERIDERVPTNNSLQDYLPAQVDVRRGKLIITADDRPSRGLRYRSGQVISRSEQRYGRWEVRAKLPRGRGMWPAIWLLPDTERYPWPGGGEIDIVENRGSQPRLTSSSFHYGTHEPYLHKHVTAEQRLAGPYGLANYHNSFHIYAVDWLKDRLHFYVDGVHHHTIHDEDVDGFLSRSTQPMRLVINIAVGGDFLSAPDNNTYWPQKMEVDWVKVYKRTGDTSIAKLTNGDFEANGGALSGWSVFGNRLQGYPNVGVASDSSRGGNSGSAVLKLFGKFSSAPTYSGVSQGISVQGGDEVTAAVDVKVPSTDSITGTDNTAVLKVEFYDRLGGKYGGVEMLDQKSLVVADGATEQDAWRRHRLTAKAPAGANEARVSLVFSQPGTAAGVVSFDNVELSRRTNRRDSQKQ